MTLLDGVHTPPSFLGGAVDVSGHGARARTHRAPCRPASRTGLGGRAGASYNVTAVTNLSHGERRAATNGVISRADAFLQDLKLSRAVDLLDKRNLSTAPAPAARNLFGSYNMYGL